jgi:hypothetical protein
MTLRYSSSYRDLGVTSTAKTADLLTVLPERAFAAQLVMICTLVALYVVTKLFHLLGGHNELRGFSWLLDLDEERNIPSFYSTLVVLLDAGLLVLLGSLYRSQRRPEVGFWFFLACVFLFLAYDEAFSVHERIGKLIGGMIGSQRGHFTWLAAGIGFAALVGALSLRFVFRMPPRTRGLIVLSGTIFVAGAVGFEIIGGWRYAQALPTVQHPDALYFACVAAEESLEMLGMALFNYTLLDHIRAEFGRLSFQIG